MATSLDALLASIGTQANPNTVTAPPVDQTVPPVLAQNVAPPPPPNSGPQDIVVTAKANPKITLADQAPISDAGLSNNVPGAMAITPPAPPGPYVPRTVDPGQYDNTMDVKALGDVSAQDANVAAQGTPAGGANNPIANFMGNHGTLRSLLGTLGDAFLVQAGHQPLYQNRVDAAKLAQAAAGYTTNPGAAADRIMASGVPGSLAEGQTGYQSFQNDEIRKQTMANEAAYRQAYLGQRQEGVDSLAQSRQDHEDQIARSTFGARLAAAPTQQAYDQTRQAIIAQLSKMPNSGINPDVEFPANQSDYNKAYGLTAGQYSRQQTTMSGQQQRGEIANMENATRQRGQDIQGGVGAQRNAVMRQNGSQTMPAQIERISQKVNQGQQLQAGEQRLWDTYNEKGRKAGLLSSIPGLGGQRQGAPQSAPQGGPIHTYASGRQAQWDGHEWVPIGKR
jgi:hypothetical protein